MDNPKKKRKRGVPEAATPGNAGALAPAPQSDPPLASPSDDADDLAVYDVTKPPPVEAPKLSSIVKIKWGYGRGTPRKYDEKYLHELSEKLVRWVARKYVRFKETGKGSIWMGDFAFENGMSRQQLSNLADPNGVYKAYNAEFVETYAWAKTGQESWAVFDEKVNSAVRKLILTNHHNYREKVEVDAPAAAGILPTSFAVQFNFYLQQMGIAPLALETIQEEPVKAEESATDFGKAFREFEG